jgi:N-dimethylarginine dimethylaminohydrolase
MARRRESLEYAANCIRVNDAVLAARGFPKTAELLSGLAHNVVELEMSEYRKVDGGRAACQFDGEVGGQGCHP